MVKEMDGEDAGDAAVGGCLEHGGHVREGAQFHVDEGGDGEKTQQESAALRGGQIVVAAFAGMTRGDDEWTAERGQQTFGGWSDRVQRIEADFEKIGRPS